jgi:hypothetical protein
LVAGSREPQEQIIKSFVHAFLLQNKNPHTMKTRSLLNEIHIGQLIKAKAIERGISEAKLATIINRHPSTIVNLYKRKAINSDQLYLISIGLDYDFSTEIYGTLFILESGQKPEKDPLILNIDAETIRLVREDEDNSGTKYRRIMER